MWPVAGLLSIGEAQQLVLAHARPLPAEPVAIEAAAGRALAQGARAAVDLPPFPSSAMDGFAVRAADTPGRLPVVGRIPAGTPATGSLEPGQAMGIATGGVVPDGADAVIPIEYVADNDNDVEVQRAAETGDHIRPRGGDIRAGEGDDEEAHRLALERALAADLVVTSGGVSVGPHDLVRRVEAELGVEEVFWRVAVKPGKPIAFGVRDGTLVFGLPGNPVSALVGFELFVAPAVRALLGAPDPLPSFERGRLAGARRRNAERDELLRARVRRSGDGAVLEPLSGQVSHMIARAADADALVFVPRGEGELADGAPVKYLRLA